MRTAPMFQLQPQPHTIVMLRWDAEFEEFIVVCRSAVDRTRNGTYHTDDYLDAMETANVIANGYGTVVTIHHTARAKMQRAQCVCGGTYELAKFCGAYVCDVCESHRGLVRCYCGWSASGGDGYDELLDAGEVIDTEY